MTCHLSWLQQTTKDHCQTRTPAGLLSNLTFGFQAARLQASFSAIFTKNNTTDDYYLRDTGPVQREDKKGEELGRKMPR